MANAALTASYDFRTIERTYSGELDVPQTLTLEPATEPHVIGYWNLKVSEITSENGLSIYHTVTLTSLRSPGQSRSDFSESYHSVVQYGRLSLTLVPAEILAAISQATGEAIPEL
jgi:hypothetical protein